MSAELKWIPISRSIPMSAKIMPCWVHTPFDDMVDLVFLTDDERYFVSTDHKRVYKVNEIDKWTIVEVP